MMTLIDTDILIDASRGVSDAVRCLQRIQAASVPAISIITQMEMMVGCFNKAELRKLEESLLQFQIVKLDAIISFKAVELLRAYRLSHGLLLPDSLIAATALTLDALLISKNQKHFQFISGLELLPYP